MAAPAPRPTYTTIGDQQRAEAAQREAVARAAENQRKTISRAADAVRDLRAQGLAFAWTVGATDTAPVCLTLVLRDKDVGRTLTDCIFGAD